jgi:hypothetical protein
MAGTRGSIRSIGMGNFHNPLYVTNYVIEPWPGGFVLRILAWELLAMTLVGILTAALSKGDARGAAGMHQLSRSSGPQNVDATPYRRKA